MGVPAVPVTCMHTAYCCGTLPQGSAHLQVGVSHQGGEGLAHKLGCFTPHVLAVCAGMLGGCNARLRDYTATVKAPAAVQA
jgi:hypothetical protein